jgi:hypothetical protein
LTVLAVVVGGILTLSSGAAAVPPDAEEATSTFDYTKNLHPLGHSFFPNTPNLPGQTFTANSDLAFWGDKAFQGHYEGFRIVDISAPAKPKQISFTECVGNQGDVVVWDDVLIRSWNSPATGTGTSLLECDGEPVEPGFEGVHIFDISDPTDPQVIAGAPLRIPYGHGRARPREQPPGRLQPDVGRALPVHHDLRGTARRSGQRQHHPRGAAHRRGRVP